MVKIKFIMWILWISSVLLKICPDNETTCPEFKTCCPSVRGFLCCPHKEGVCCPDFSTCCSKGYKCTTKGCELIHQKSIFYTKRDISNSTYTVPAQ